MTTCRFCGSLRKSLKALIAHECTCPENVERVGINPWNKGKTKETCDGLKKFSENMIGKDRSYTYETWKLIHPDNEIFTENSSFSRGMIKKRLLYNKWLEYKCSICGIEAIWNNKPMPLILDHINGINNDNRRENLRFVCSNCDSQLDTYKAKNKKEVVRLVEETVLKTAASP